MKRGYFAHLECETEVNTDFARVLYTGEQIQLALMSLKPGEQIGNEIHPENDQFFRFDKGEGKVVVNDTEYTVRDGDSVIVPRGASHNVLNTSPDQPLQFYTLYAPPHHKDGTVHPTREHAVTREVEFDGIVTES